MSSLNYLNKNLSNIDWDFTNFSNEGLNSFHWYPATFISAIPGSIIPIITNENDLVLDTFCGTSVTGYEAIRLGRRYIGVDNNPIASLISKAKLLYPDTKTLLNVFDELFTNPFIVKQKVKKHPNEEILKLWYHPQTYNELAHILAIIAEIESPILKIPAQAVFSSILKKTCSQSKHWGWVCDNVIPKPNEITYKNAIDTFSKALTSYCLAVDETLEDIKHRNIDNRRKELRDKWEIHCSDSIKTLGSIPTNSVDLIHTSPPYYGVADYVKAQRLSFLWFHKDILSVEGFSYENFEQLRKSEAGARSNRHKASSFIDYMNYMNVYLNLCHYVLKRRGYLVLIIGDSKARKETISHIDESALKVGFSIEFEFQREIRESRRRLMAKVQNEQIKIYRKK